MGNGRIALLAPQRARLAKILGLLGSDHDGEAAAAGRRADAMVKAAGITWAEILECEVANQHGEMRSRDMVAMCLEQSDIYTDREVEFLWSIRQQLQRGRTLSQRQGAWLLALYDRAQAAP